MPSSASGSPHTAFRKREHWGKAGWDGARPGRGRARQWAVGHGGATEGCAVALEWLTCRPVVLYLSEAAEVAKDQQFLNLWQMSCWALEEGLDSGNFLI